MDGYDSTKVYKNGKSNWFYDTDAYKVTIATLRASGGGDTPESVVEALETARLLDMRASAGKFFILVTDANYKIGNRYDIPTMAYEIELLKNAGVCASVVTSNSYKSTYTPLYEQTDGIWANIYGDFYTELMTLADKIGDDVVGDGYWIYLTGPVPTPVRLDEKPYAGSTVDTDGDGIYDIDELESIEPTGEVDLDEIIRTVSKGAITDTSYGVVKTYNYKSTPIARDTDYDGIIDKLDPEPKNNTFKAVMKDDDYDINSNISYTVDLRTFFSDNEKFNKNLCVTSSIFSSVVYDGITIEGTHANGLLKKHGFKDVRVYKLSDDYTDEHLSEIAIGYKQVEYDNKTKEIVSVVVRGTNGTIQEWSSNFDLGSTDEVGGDWEEWVNHKGFDIAATRILRYIYQYVEDNNLGTSSEIVFWVSGHSRGAAIANIIGARLGYKTFTYTFAAPNTTTDRLTSQYKGIFNIVNSDDFVTYLPMKAWEFGKYGRTAIISIGDKYKKEWKDFTWKIYNRDEYGMQKTIDTLANVAKDRNDCYIYTCDCHGNGSRDNITASYWSQFPFSRDKAIEGIPANAKKYCQITLYDAKLLGEQWGFEICQTPAYYMQLMADTMTKNNLKDKIPFAFAYIIAPRYQKAHKCVISSAIGGLEHPHYLETYYLLSTHVNSAMFK